MHIHRLDKSPIKIPEQTEDQYFSTPQESELLTQNIDHNIANLEEEDNAKIAQSNSPLNDKSEFSLDKVVSRQTGKATMVTAPAG